MPARVLIVGASVRAQVESALRAGFAVDALDLFADRDTRLLIGRATDESISAEQSVASSISQIQGFTDVLTFMDQFKRCDAAIVCGGIENRIELVEAIEKRFQLLGPGSDALSRIGDCVAVQQTMSRCLGPEGINVTSTLRQIQPESKTEQLGSPGWLAKKNWSSGGLGVELADSLAADDSAQTRDSYFQQKVSGESISVLYLSRGGGQSIMDGVSGSATTILGLTQQLVGDESLGASRFQYCGSVGPLDPTEIGQAIDGPNETSPDHLRQIQRIGDFLAQQYRLVGVWGIDFIVNQAGVWPVDVNARLTGSAELYESRIAATTGFKSIIDLHIAACVESTDVPPRSDWAKLGMGQWGLVEGKLILFNRSSNPIEITNKLSDGLMDQFEVGFFGSDQIGATLADIPSAGDSIQPGHPILTIRVRCSSAEEVRVETQELAERVYRMLER